MLPVRRAGATALLLAALAAAPAAAQDTAKPVNTAPPVVTGVAMPNEMLTCEPGSWTGEPYSFVYVWRDNGAVLEFSEKLARVPLESGGHDITCTVTAQNLGGDSAPATSAPLKIGFLSDGAPKVTTTPTSKIVRKGRKAYIKLKLLCAADARGSCQGQIQVKYKASLAFQVGTLNFNLAPGKPKEALVPILPIVAKSLKETKKQKVYLVCESESESGKTAKTVKRITIKN